MANDFDIITDETDLGHPGRFKAAKELTVKVSASASAGPVTCKVWADRVLKQTISITTVAAGGYQIKKYRLNPTCRGESFYLQFTNTAGKAAQVWPEASGISDFVVLPQGVTQ